MDLPVYGEKASGSVVRSWEDEGRRYAAIELSAAAESESEAATDPNLLTALYDCGCRRPEIDGRMLIICPDHNMPLTLGQGPFVPSSEPSPVVVPEPEMPPSVDMVFPLGGKIEMGERATQDGPTVFIALTTSGADAPSLIWWVDPISKQSLITTFNRSDGHQSYVIDKIMASLRGGIPGNPFVGG